jgi:hypothetical protein
MGTRLTEERRRAIVERLIRHRFSKETEALVAKWQVFEDSVYDEVYPKKIQAAMAALPDGFLTKGGLLKVIFGGETTNVKVSLKRPVSNAHLEYSATVKVFDAKDPLTLQFRELSKEEAAFRAKREAARAAAKSVLRSCNTVKQLVEVWPESAPFVKDFLEFPKCVALTVTPKELNAHFNL